MVYNNLKYKYIKTFCYNNYRYIDMSEQAKIPFSRKATLSDFFDDVDDTNNSNNNNNNQNNKNNNYSHNDTNTIAKNQQEFGNRKRIKP